MGGSNTAAMPLPRCPHCSKKYEGHRSGSYHPQLKVLYSRSGSAGRFVAAARICENCGRIYSLDGALVGQLSE